MNIYEKLTNLQNELKVPKTNRNTFGNYNYRNCEDILEGVKPLLAKHKLSLYISDALQVKEDRHYVTAMIRLINIENIEENIIVEASAREEGTKKGMDGCQITGSSSSYARKYALNGLFAIDDTKDSDALATTQEKSKQPSVQVPQNIPTQAIQKTPTQPPKITGKVISVAQARRLFAVAKGNNDLVKDAVSSYGYASSKDILVADYKNIEETIVKTLENMEANI